MNHLVEQRRRRRVTESFPPDVDDVASSPPISPTSTRKYKPLRFLFRNFHPRILLTGLLLVSTVAYFRQSSRSNEENANVVLQLQPPLSAERGLEPAKVPSTTSRRIMTGTTTTTTTTTTSSFHTNNHTHRIPNILIFTHAINLLEPLLLLLPTDNATTSPEMLAEWHVLQHNVRAIVDLHPGATIRFLTNSDCVTSIRRAVESTWGVIATAKLVHHFEKETRGMYKADLCRGAALYETGGVYFDVDLGVRLNVWTVLNPNTEFSTIRVHNASKQPGAFFQAFMAVTPHHAVIERYLQLFYEYYEGHLPKYHDRPLGVVMLKDAFDDVVVGSGSNNNNNSQAATHTTTTTISEIFQEVPYRWDWQHSYLRGVAPPTWGARRACKFIVVTGNRPPLTVPFYSRIAGSRMCPPAAAAV